MKPIEWFVAAVGLLALAWIWVLDPSTHEAVTSDLDKAPAGVRRSIETPPPGLPASDERVSERTTPESERVPSFGQAASDEHTFAPEAAVSEACGVGIEASPTRPNVDEIVASYEHALELDPAWTNGWIELGILERGSGSGDGRESFETAAALARENGQKPLEAIALEALGRALIDEFLKVRSVLNEAAYWERVLKADDVCHEAAALYRELGDGSSYRQVQFQLSRLWKVAVAGRPPEIPPLEEPPLTQTPIEMTPFEPSDCVRSSIRSIRFGRRNRREPSR